MIDVESEGTLVIGMADSLLRRLLRAGAQGNLELDVAGEPAIISLQPGRIAGVSVSGREGAEALLRVADSIATATRSFIAASDGTELAAVDPLWDPDARPAVIDATTDGTTSSRGPGRVTELLIPTTTDPAGATGPDGGDPPAT